MAFIATTQTVIELNEYARVRNVPHDKGDLERHVDPDAIHVGVVVCASTAQMTKERPASNLELVPLRIGREEWAIVVWFLSLADETLGGTITMLMDPEMVAGLLPVDHLPLQHWADKIARGRFSHQHARRNRRMVPVMGTRRACV